MKKQFISYELAIKLKELGFNENCLAYFKDDEFKIPNPHEPFRNSEMKAWFVSTPLWQQAFDYFREKGYESEINRNIPEMEKQEYKKYSFYIWSEHTNPRGNYTDRKLNSTETYEEARQACLEKLIEIIKNNERKT